MRCLIIDDDAVDRENIVRMLADVDEGIAVQQAADEETALEALGSDKFDFITLDYRMPRTNGLALLDKIKSLSADCTSAVIMLTGEEDETIAIEAMSHGAVDYLSKQEVSAALLKRSVRYAIARQQHLTAEREAGELLKKACNELSELYKTAHQFVDNVSHEFRTPLTVIKEFASILSEGLIGEVSEEQNEYLKTIVDRVDDLAVMVDDMLDISKLEAGLLSVHRQKCTVASIAEHVRTTIERKAATSGINLTMTIDGSLPPVYCDPENIGRVVINLAINACKFTAAGGEVSVWAHRDAESSQVVVGVSDNGPGIAPENVQAIFERFEQVGGNVRGSSEGFGLGLNIAKELVGINLGDMAVESELGRGSTFSFTIPVFDPGKVVRRFLDRIDSFRNGFSYVSLISVRIPALEDKGIVDEVGRFLNDQIRRSDFLIGTRPGSWVVCAPANRIHLDKMFTRIANALETTNRNRPGEPLPALNFETKATWKVGEPSDAFLDCVETEFAFQEA